ncbi:MAG: hypothetical protein ACRCUY_07245, partial [Thermoguttaceae bacterium]
HLSIPDDMRANWKPLRGIRPAKLKESMLQEGISAKFDYFVQPFLFRGQLVSPQTRINVKPEYTIQVEKGILLLNARLSFVVHGAKTDKVALHLPGWKWNGEIKPANLIDFSDVEQGSDGLLTIPLRSPIEGNFELELKAYQQIPIADGKTHRLVIPLPQPVATWSEPASLTILPADNVELIPLEDATIPPLEASFALSSPHKTIKTPEISETGKTSESQQTSPIDSAISSKTTPKNNPPENVQPENNPQENVQQTPESQMSGLTRRSVRQAGDVRVELPTRQQIPLFYRAERSDAVFVADVIYHRQQARVTQLIQLHPSESMYQVTSTFLYDVQYAPVDSLTFRIPKAIQDTNTIQFSLGDKELTLRDIPLAEKENQDSEETLKRLVLPEGQIGKFQVTFKYSIPHFSLEPDVTTGFSVPLIQSADIPCLSQQLDIILRPGVSIDIQDECAPNWKVIESSISNQGHHGSEQAMLCFLTKIPQDKILLWGSLISRDTTGTTILDQAWIQTWLSESTSMRMDRCLFSVNSDRDTLSIWLPQKTLGEHVLVFLDQMPLALIPSAKGELVIPLRQSFQSNQGRQTSTIEVWYRIPYSESYRHAPLQLPHFGIETLVRNMYWQLILPSDKHIIETPSGWIPEYQWTWNGLFWGRSPSMTLDSIGFKSNLSEYKVPDEANQYLFSTFHPPVEVALSVLNRSTIVFMSSGVALVIGLILMYIPQSRYLGAIFGLGLAFLGILFYQPASMLILLQSASFGVVLLLIAGYFYHLFVRDEHWIIPSKSTKESRTSLIYPVIVEDSTHQDLLHTQGTVQLTSK